MAKCALVAASSGGENRALAGQLLEAERTVDRLASQKAVLERRLDACAHTHDLPILHLGSTHLELHSLADATSLTDDTCQPWGRIPAIVPFHHSLASGLQMWKGILAEVTYVRLLARDVNCACSQGASESNQPGR